MRKLVDFGLNCYYNAVMVNWVESDSDPEIVYDQDLVGPIPDQGVNLLVQSGPKEGRLTKAEPAYPYSTAVRAICIRLGIDLKEN